MRIAQSAPVNIKSGMEGTQRQEHKLLDRKDRRKLRTAWRLNMKRNQMGGDVDSHSLCKQAQIEDNFGETSGKRKVRRYLYIMVMGNRKCGA
jgi:hypothetical protein